jgi:hypothetical protein
MMKAGISNDELDSKPYLSDHHSALMSVCSGKRHFLCLRHLIKRFRATSFKGQIARRLAFSSTQQQFYNEIDQVIQDILSLIEKDEIQFEELKQLEAFGLRTNNGDLYFDAEYWEPQAIWTRALFGVATCSNHSEGFHRSLNEVTRGYNLLTRRLYAMIESIYNRYHSALEYLHTQGKRLLTKLASE